MKANEYVTTIVVYGKMVNVGMDDYGQQYFLEFLNDDGELIEFGCGSYNHDFEEVAKTVINHRRHCIEIFGEEEYLEMERLKAERMKKYEEKEKLDDTSI